MFGVRSHQSLDGHIERVELDTNSRDILNDIRRRLNDAGIKFLYSTSPLPSTADPEQKTTSGLEVVSRHGIPAELVTPQGAVPITPKEYTFTGEFIKRFWTDLMSSGQYELFDLRLQQYRVYPEDITRASIPLFDDQTTFRVRIRLL